MVDWAVVSQYVQVNVVAQRSCVQGSHTANAVALQPDSHAIVMSRTGCFPGSRSVIKCMTPVSVAAIKCADRMSMHDCAQGRI